MIFDDVKDFYTKYLRRATKKSDTMVHLNAASETTYVDRSIKCIYNYSLFVKRNNIGNYSRSKYFTFDFIVALSV